MAAVVTHAAFAVAAAALMYVFLFEPEGWGTLVVGATISLALIAVVAYATRPRQ